MLVGNVGDNDLASIDLVDEELLHLSVGLVLLEVPMHNQQVLVEGCLRFLNFLQEDNHVGSCLDLNASPLAGPEAMALLFEGQVDQRKG